MPICLCENVFECVSQSVINRVRVCGRIFMCECEEERGVRRVKIASQCERVRIRVGNMTILQEV